MTVSGTEDLSTGIGLPAGQIDQFFTQENITFADKPTVLINMSSPRMDMDNTDSVMHILKHEIGHALVGLLHPHDAAFLMQESPGEGQSHAHGHSHTHDGGHDHSHMPCSAEELEYFMNPDQPAIMAYAENPIDAVMSPYEVTAMGIVKDSYGKPNVEVSEQAVGSMAQGPN